MCLGHKLRSDILQEEVDPWCNCRKYNKQKDLPGNLGQTYKLALATCKYYAGIEFKDLILGFRQSTFLCTTLKCIEKFRIPFIKSGIPASNLGFTEARNPLKFAA